MQRSAITLDPADWQPASGQHLDGQPELGQLMGLWYGVWEIINVYPVEDVDLTDPQRRQLAYWTGAAREKHRPFGLRLKHVSGPCLARTRRLHDGSKVVGIRGEALMFRGHLLPERYKVCSCHGDPWPCQDVDRDEHTTLRVRELDKLTGKMAGCCWSCNEPLTTRQKSVTYAGDNLDLPGGPPVRFHLRRQCWHDATRYEERWIAVDPRNERVLTWPACNGILIVHGDGSSECRSSANYTSEANCLGHLTHDHTTLTACYCAGGGYQCGRGCAKQGHPGTRTSPRPPREQFQDTLKGSST